MWLGVCFNLLLLELGWIDKDSEPILAIGTSLINLIFLVVLHIDLVSIDFVVCVFLMFSSFWPFWFFLMFASFSCLFGFILMLDAKLGASFPGHYLLASVILYAFLFVRILSKLELVASRLRVLVSKCIMTK